MTTTTPTMSVSLVRAAQLLAAHLADHHLPPSVSVDVLIRPTGPTRVTVQLRSATVATVASELLAWADTLTTVTVGAWREPDGQWIHLSITATLTSGPAGTIELRLFGATNYDPRWFADLQPDQRHTASLGQLRTWASIDGSGASR